MGYLFLSNLTITQDGYSSILKLNFGENVNEGLIKVFDIKGKEYMEFPIFNSQSEMIPIGGLPIGMYFMSINVDGKRVVKKMMKR